MDRRVVAALALGLVGLGSGVAAGVASAPLLGVAAGACALGSAMFAVHLAGAMRQQADETAMIDAGLADLHTEVARLQAAASAGEEAIRVAGALAEMMAQRNQQLVEQDNGDLLDDGTGLLDARYFRPALESRVAAARRLLRPVSIVLLDLDRAPGAGDEEHRETVTRFSDVLKRILREADTACRLGETRFGLILEDTPEGGGVWAAERIRFGFAQERGEVRYLSAGVASYPSHALDAGDLAARAEQALERAKSSGRGQVEVAPVE